MILTPPPHLQIDFAVNQTLRIHNLDCEFCFCHRVTIFFEGKPPQLPPESPGRAMEIAELEMAFIMEMALIVEINYLFGMSISTAASRDQKPKKQVLPPPVLERLLQTEE
jgi:hypothetical protein